MFALDILNQYQSENGNVLAAGKLFIYKQGRTELAEIYSDINGSVELANPVILNNLGMTDTPVYLSRLYSYTVVCKNMYGEELFSRDVYPNIDSDAGPAISGYLYEGISPIVVNNVDKAISAINVPIGVQEPLYFVEDSSAACIIGIDSTGMLSGYVTSGDLATVSGEITAMIPTALTGEYLDKASADTLYYPLNTNPSGYLVEDDITGKQDVSAMTAYVQNSALTAQLTLSGGNGVSLVEDYINDVLWINVTAEGGDTAVNSLVHANSGTWDSVTGKQDELTFAYDNVNAISSINNSAISTTPSRDLYIQAPLFTGMSGTSAYLGCSAGGGEFPASADEACALVQTNSATWDGVTGKLDKTASANFYTTANPSGFMRSGQFKLYNYQVTGIVLNGVTRDIKAANSTYANTATNAEYDTNGNSLTALYDFIQNNSASWTGGGGGGSGSTSNIIYKQFGSGYGGSGVYLSGSGDVIFSVYAPNGISTITIYYPNTLSQDTVYFSPDYNQYNIYTALYTVTGYANPDLNVQDVSDWQISAGDMIIMNPNTAGFGVGSGSFIVNSTAYLTTGNIEMYDSQQGYYQQITSWYDTLSDYQISGATGQDNYAIHMNGDQYDNNYSWEISVKSLGGGNTGSTVTSADVLPSTDNLDPYTTYTLKWSTYGGGLYWGT